MINKGYSTSDITETGDERFTPFYAVDPIFEFLPPPSENLIIWCPFDEKWSAFVVSLKERGYNVIYSSLKDGHDFFKYEPDSYSMIISNPPFSKKDEVLYRLYKLNKPFIMLLPTASLQGRKRFEIFNNNIQLLTFDARICYHDSGHMDEPVNSVPFASSYFCKDILPTKLELRKLNKYSRKLM